MSALTYNELLDYHLIANVEKNLETLKAQAEAINSEWDGDDSGVLEDRAHAAAELIEKIDEIKELIEELL
jgi:hypothetical protein